MRSLLPIVTAVALLLVGCASSGMTSEQQDQIPRGSDAVMLESEADPDDLYRAAFQRVRDAGLRMDESNEEMRSFSTDGGPVGESSQVLRVDVIVEETGEGSTLTGRADVQVSGLGWMRASMAGRGSEPRVGFEELVLLMEDLPHQDMRFVEE